MKFMKHFGGGGTSYKSLGTSGIWHGVFYCGIWITLAFVTIPRI
jgi:hypothetical protein